MIQITSTTISMGRQCRAQFIVDDDRKLSRGLGLIFVAEGIEFAFSITG